MPELDRRDFLRLVGAGAGAAAAAGCSEPVEKLIPYVVQPGEITPGLAVHYASTCRECPAGCGLHVKTREGRPIKLEGNPAHPVNRGSLCARGQAAIGRSYHPDRYDGPMQRSDGSLARTSWDDARSALVEKLRTSAARTWVLGGHPGPTVGGLVDTWVQAVGAAGRLVYEPFAYEALREATRAVFGVAVIPLFDLSKADLVVDLGSDFLDGWLSPTEHARQLAEARDVHAHPDGGARLVSVGPRLSLTASNADEWVPAAPGSEGTLALALARLVFQSRQANGGIAGDLGAVETVLQRVDPQEAASRAGIDRRKLDALAERLLAARAPVVLPPGVGLTSARATETTAAVLLLDAVLGAVGGPIRLPASETRPPAASLREIRALVDAMRAGEVDVLLVHDANPVYSLPADLGFAEALENVDLVVSFAPLKDETSERADLVLPDHTALESWGDAMPRAGVHSLVQPTLRPLKDTQALGDTLLAVGRELGAEGLPEGSVRSLVEAAWNGASFRDVQQQGGRFGDTPTREGVAIAASVAQLDFRPPQLEGTGDYVLLAHPHPFLADGGGAALPWLQEIPDPVTKATWQSWAELSKETASKLGLGFGDVVAIETGYGAGRIEVPVYPRGGIRHDVVAVAIGQGHTVGYYASLEGDGRPGAPRGASVLSILPAVADGKGGRAFLSVKARLSPTGAFHRIPITQWTDNQRGRGLAQEVPLATLASPGAQEAEAEPPAGHQEHVGRGNTVHTERGLYRAYEMKNDADPESPYRWAMTIDTDRCNGCSACVAACYVENNLPIVGEAQVLRHREMAWLRIERYVGEGVAEGGHQRRPYPNREELGENEVRHVPMLCQHCGAAPCEPVCPVIATYHNPEGLNGMIYNRCVGTRYCANNCTYKVRRFNYWDYGRLNWPGLLGMMLNPDVTVRGQGVMEKCTFCVQRIAAARQPAKDEGRSIADGEVMTACQQACPTQAISFGNARDAESVVMKKADEPARAYHALGVLNTRPGITYLAQVRREGGEGEQGGHHA